MTEAARHNRKETERRARRAAEKKSKAEFEATMAELEAMTDQAMSEVTGMTPGLPFSDTWQATSEAMANAANIEEEPQSNYAPPVPWFAFMSLCMCAMQ